MSDDVVAGGEDSVGQPVVAHELPDVLPDVELGALGWPWQQGDVGRHVEPGWEMPARLIQQQHGMATGADHGGDLGQVQAHPPGCCTKAAPLPSCGATGLVPRPAAGDLVLLACAGLVGEPDFPRIEADFLVLRDACQHRPDVARNRRFWKKYQGRLAPERLVFIDETWAQTNMTRTRGRSLQGAPLLSKFPMVTGKL